MGEVWTSVHGAESVFIMALTPFQLSSLKQMPLFVHLPDDLFLRLTEGARVDGVREGETLFTQGAPVRFVFVVIEGWVKLSRLSATGIETIIQISSRGQSFGETQAISGLPHSATGQAVSPAVIARFHASAFVNCVQESPKMAMHLCSATAAKLTSLIDEIETLKSVSVDQRVTRFILQLCTVVDGACDVHLPYGQNLIAAHLGIKAETLSRSLARLRNVGVTPGHGTRELHVADVKRLRMDAEALVGAA